MACELMSAKIVISVFGVSVHVWSVVLGVTLTSIALGYLAGGIASSKTQNPNLVYWILASGAMFIMLMPVLGSHLMAATIGYGIITGSFLTLLGILLPALVCMGMTLPVVISLLTRDLENAGRDAGTVYAISTVGGILSTFACGFWLLPTFGIRSTALFFTVTLVTIPVVMLSLQRRPAVLIYPVVAAIVLLTSPDMKLRAGRVSIVHQSEGILGQLKVVDAPMYSEFDNRIIQSRALLVNNSSQTIIEKGQPQNSMWAYPYFIQTLTSMYPAGSPVLLLGLGGGSIAKRLESSKFNLDIVDIDERLVPIAKRFFGASPDLAITVDDGRHYLKTSAKRYDAIISDMYLSESVPLHTVTVEFFAELKSHLNAGGVLLINFYGQIEGPDGRAGRCLLKTLTEAGYEALLVGTTTDPDWREIIFVATVGPLDLTNIQPLAHNYVQIDDITEWIIDTSNINLEHALVLTDDKPLLDQIYMGPVLKWRRGDNKIYTEKFFLAGQPVFR